MEWERGDPRVYENCGSAASGLHFWASLIVPLCECHAHLADAMGQWVGEHPCPLTPRACSMLIWRVLQRHFALMNPNNLLRFVGILDFISQLPVGGGGRYICALHITSRHSTDHRLLPGKEERGGGRQARSGWEPSRCKPT